MFADETGKFESLFTKTPANVRRVARRVTQRRIQAETIRKSRLAPARGRRRRIADQPAARR
jgi:hypothetical protein